MWTAVIRHPSTDELATYLTVCGRPLAMSWPRHAIHLRYSQLVRDVARVEAETILTRGAPESADTSASLAKTRGISLHVALFRADRIVALGRPGR